MTVMTFAIIAVIIFVMARNVERKKLAPDDYFETASHKKIFRVMRKIEAEPLQINLTKKMTGLVKKIKIL